ncbi:MAG: hypothetical protein LIP02_07040 [Bacteroidales bacterium]|nr:hypothetical protein [Bacteroidales bacterium]
MELPQWLKYTITILLVLIGLWLPTLTLNVAFYQDDECYQALCTLQEDAMSPIAPLTFMIGRWWQALCGEGLVQLHWLAYWIRIAGAVVVSLWFWRRTGRSVLASLVFVVMTSAPVRQPFYDWNVTSEFFLFCLIIGMIEYWRQPRLWLAVAMSGLVALAGMFRAPSLISGVVLIVVVGIRLKWNRQFWVALGWGTLVLMLIWVGVIWLCFGSFEDYLGCFAERYIVSSHNRWYHFLGPIWRAYLPHNWPSLLLGIGVIAWMWVSAKVAPTRWALWIDFALGIGASSWLLQRMVGNGDWLWGYTWAMYGFYIFAYCHVKRYLSGDLRVAGVLALVFMVLPMLGTNVPLARFAVVPFFAMWLYAVLPQWRTWWTGTVLAMMVTLISYTAVFSFRRFHKEFDLPTGECTVGMRLPYFEGITMFPQYKEIFTQGYLTLLPYAQQPGGVMILGHTKYVYQLALRDVNAPDPWPHRVEYHQRDDSATIVKEFREVAPRYNTVAIANLFPWDQDKTRGMLIKEIHAQGYVLKEDNGYNCTIYCRP